MEVYGITDISIERFVNVRGEKYPYDGDIYTGLLG